LTVGGESYGRIVFRKPAKRSTDDNDGVLSASSMSKKARTEKDSSQNSDVIPDRDKTHRTEERSKPNSSLLSFNDDDDDDDDDDN